MAEQKQIVNNSYSIGVLPILGIIFVTLKLCGVIDWSWWLVVSPFLCIPVFWLLVLFTVGFFAGIAILAGFVYAAWNDKLNRR
jgi:hypothetical protein